MNVFLGKITMKQLCTYKATGFIIFFSIAICVFSLLLLTEEMFYSSDFLTKVDEQKRTYQLDYGFLTESTEGEDEHYVIDKKTTYHFVNELLKSTGIPVEKVKNIHAYPENYRESFADYIVVQGLEERLEKPSIPVTEGRTFSEEEMKNGDNVIIINNSDRLAGMAGKMVGDSVIIDHVPYQVIGITSASENYITYANAVKANTYRLMVGSVLFSRQLSPKQTKAWDKLLGACGIKAISEYDNSIDGYVHNVVRFFCIILIFMFFILMIIVRLFSYMSSHRSEEYSIYHKLGVEPFVFLLMYYAPVILLAVFGELAGLCIYAASRTLKAYINMSHQLSWVTQAAVVAIVFLIVCGSVYPIYRRAGEDLCGK